MASYTDNGNESIKPITSRSQINLRYHKIEGGSFDKASKNIESDQRAKEIFDGNYLLYKNIDLTDLESLRIGYNMRKDRETGGTIELRLDKPDGTLIGKAEIEDVVESESTEIAFSNAKGFHDLYLVFKKEKNKDKSVVMIDYLEFIPHKNLPLK